MPKSEPAPPSTAKPAKAAFPVDPKYAHINTNRPMSQTKAYQDKERWYAAQIEQQMPGYQDPFAGADPLTALLTDLVKQKSGPSGSGSRGGGGGGAATALQAKAWADAQAALDAQGQQENAGFDQRQHALQGIQSDSAVRLSGILGELNAGAGQARAQTAQAYGAGDARLQGLMSEYQGISQNRDAQANQTLGAFGSATGGASGSVNPSGAGVQDMIMAGRTANTMRGNAADQLYAQRGNVYNGLGADAKQQSGQTFDALLAQLAQERQAQSASLAQQRAQLALQQAGK